MNLRMREAVRYLGYGKNAVDDLTYNQISESFTELSGIIRERYIYRIFDVEVCREQKRIKIGPIDMVSEYLIKNMQSCQRAVLFGATLGAETDLLIKRHTVTHMARAVIVQACAAVLMEELCDKVEAKVRAELPADKKLRPRFSPGYGDLSIEYQGQILEALEMPKRIGLTMTDSYMLSPTKSVTAFIGITATKEEGGE